MASAMRPSCNTPHPPGKRPVGQHARQLDESVSENPPLPSRAPSGRFQQLARLRRPEGQGHDRPGAPLLPLLKDDAPPVEGGDAAGHLQSKTQAARPLKQLPLIGFREKTRSVVPHGEDRPPAPAGQAQAGLSALSRRADGVGDQVEQQPPELEPRLRQVRRLPISSS